MMTEDEARARWCPFSRAAIYPAPEGKQPLSANRVRDAADDLDPIPVDGCSCLASSCMAWRWDMLPMDGAPDQDIAAKRGHCGLAGAP